MNSHPIFWLMIAAVAAPLLGQIPLGFKVPVVVLEVVLGIVIGPHVLDLVHFDGFVAMILSFATETVSWEPFTGFLFH